MQLYTRAAICAQVQVLVSRPQPAQPDSDNHRGASWSSAFFGQLLPGTELRCELVNLPSFRLPEDADAGVVMVAAGAGLAPLRALIQVLCLRAVAGNVC